MDIYTKSIAINNLDKLAEMDISTGEYNKMDQWINGLIKLPFGKMDTTCLIKIILIKNVIISKKRWII